MLNLLFSFSCEKLELSWKTHKLGLPTYIRFFVCASQSALTTSLGRLLANVEIALFKRTAVWSDAEQRGSKKAETTNHIKIHDTFICEFYDKQEAVSSYFTSYHGWKKKNTFKNPFVCIFLPSFNVCYCFILFHFIFFFVSHLQNATIYMKMVKCHLKRERATYFHSDLGQISCWHSAILIETEGQGTNRVTFLLLYNVGGNSLASTCLKCSPFINQALLKRD